jgi:hypothetical protein
MVQNPFDNADSTYNQQEFKLQLAVVKHLASAFPHLLYTHVANRPANAKDGYFKKLMGVRPGVADLLFWWKTNNGMKCGAIELKIGDNKQSNDQSRFASAFVHQGGFYAVCKSVSDIHNTLMDWGIPARHHQCIEADDRSKQQKNYQSFEFFQP